MSKFPIHMEVELYRSGMSFLPGADKDEYEEAKKIVKRQIRAELGWDVYVTMVMPEDREKG